MRVNKDAYHIGRSKYFFCFVCVIDTGVLELVQSKCFGKVAMGYGIPGMSSGVK